jgi:hypothetical protein
MKTIFENNRLEYHKNVFHHLLFVDSAGIPNNADKHSNLSVALAKGIVERINLRTSKIKGSGQTSGKSFEKLTASFIEKSFQDIKHLRNGKFEFFIGKSIDEFEQYDHLSILKATLRSNKILQATLGDYIISPDIVIGRLPLNDIEINQFKKVVYGRNISRLTPMRKVNSNKQILHASISCKWTIRSDRSQNARTEGLNLIRNRKGHTPHIVIVTAEPYPQRIASLALGTGDIDCVYHFALNELLDSAKDLKNESVSEMLNTMVEGKRLRDIADLPFDLVT